MLNKTLKIINQHPTGLREHCAVEESVEHVICVCQKCTNEREIMKNDLRKMGMKNIVTYGLESLFLYLKRTDLINLLTVTPIFECRPANVMSKFKLI